jgi:hypothetical protein
MRDIARDNIMHLYTNGMSLKNILRMKECKVLQIESVDDLVHLIYTIKVKG